jgi:hypothetical protein
MTSPGKGSCVGDGDESKVAAREPLARIGDCPLLGDASERAGFELKDSLDAGRDLGGKRHQRSLASAQRLVRV